MTSFRRLTPVLSTIALVAAGLAIGAPPASAAGGPTSDPGAFVALAPSRILDTGAGTGAPKAAIKAHATLTLQVTGHGGVPTSNVGAVLLNVTVASATKGGYVTAYPTGATRPVASSLNFTAGITVANAVTAQLGTGGKVTFYNGSAGTIRLVADVNGYYLQGTAAAPGTLQSMSPVRILDTGAGTGAPQAAIPANGTLTLQVTGAVGIPSSGVGAVLLNVTVASAKAGGHITAYPTGGTVPLASNINFPAGQTTANSVTAQLGTGGQVTFANVSAGTIRLVADVNGYFLSGTAAAPGTLQSTAPTRILDTGAGTGAPQAAVAAHGTLTLTVTGHAGVPSTGVGAVLLNVTVASAKAGGYITAHPNGSTRPLSSSVNFIKGQTIANSVTAQLGTGGKITFYNGSAGTVRLVADVNGYFLADPGSITWSPATAITSDFSTYDVTCLSATFCLAVGADQSNQASSFVYNGTSWSSATSTGTPLGAVSCTSTTFCVGLSFDGAAEIYNGTTWSASTQVTAVGRSLQSVSCISTTFCVAVDAFQTDDVGDTDGHIYKYNGTAWSTYTSSSEGLLSVSCVSATFCVAGGVDATTMTFNGTSWAHVALGFGQSSVIGLSCTSATFCMATTHDSQGGAATAKFNGTTWSTGDGDEAETLSCVSSTFCLDANLSSSTVSTQTWNGTAWADGTTLAGGTSFLVDASCVSTTFCVAITSDGYSSKFNGSTWGAATAIQPSQGDLSDVSCSSPSFCVAVTEAGYAVKYQSGTWGTPAAVADRSDLLAVSCAATTLCVAIDFEGNAYTYNGTTWSAAHALSGELLGISCPTTTFCMALGTGPSGSNGPDSAFTFNGSTWSSAQLISAAGQLDDVSCSSATFCMAVGEAGTKHAYSFNGTTWSSGTAVADYLQQVSCGSSTSCVALGDATYTFDGTSWSGAAGPDLSDVSCATSSFCGGVSSDAAYSRDGVVWSNPQSIPGITSDLWAISCPTTAFCMAITSFTDAAATAP